MSGSSPPTNASGTRRHVVLRAIAAGVAWVALYTLNEHLWVRLFAALGFDSGNRVAEAAQFFGYDTAKVLLLLVGMIFLIGMLRTTIRPETVRTYLRGRSLPVALVMAAVFGAITPFCSCSSIPLFIGFVAAGIPMPVTLTFLIASPLVNEVAVVMLGQSFGWQITIAYVAAGLSLATLLGAVFSRLALDEQVADFVRNTPTARLHEHVEHPTVPDRIHAAGEETAEILGRVWKWVVVGVAVGAVIHGWVPTEVLTNYAGPDNPLAVPVVSLLGIPLYSNAAGVVPIAQALWAKGMATGTVLSFMMATVALSLPEFVLLKQVLKPRLLAVYFGSVAVGIIVIGLVFNAFFF